MKLNSIIMKQELKEMRDTLYSLFRRLSELEKKDEEINFVKGWNYVETNYKLP